MVVAAAVVVVLALDLIRTASILIISVSLGPIDWLAGSAWLTRRLQCTFHFTWDFRHSSGQNLSSKTPLGFPAAIDKLLKWPKKGPCSYFWPRELSTADKQVVVVVLSTAECSVREKKTCRLVVRSPQAKTT